MAKDSLFAQTNALAVKYPDLARLRNLVNQAMERPTAANCEKLHAECDKAIETHRLVTEVQQLMKRLKLWCRDVRQTSAVDPQAAFPKSAAAA